MKCLHIKPVRNFVRICTLILIVDIPSIFDVLLFKVIYIHEKSIKIYPIKNLSNNPCINLWLKFRSPRHFLLNHNSSITTVDFAFVEFITPIEHDLLPQLSTYLKIHSVKET